jgi:Kdo2-lipid IVA lauroyltransferase/acyltransferase
MRKNFWIDWTGYFALKALGPFLRALPVEAAFFLGRRMGDVWWMLDAKHRAQVYANLTRALGKELSCSRRKKLVRENFQSLAQGVIELLFIPRMDQSYLSRFVTIEGLEHVRQAQATGKGMIFLSVHSGSWELSNLLGAAAGLRFKTFVRDQRMPKLAGLLNAYRRKRGFQVIEREGQLRDLVRTLQQGEAIGMSQDQGGSAGTLVDFFGTRASMGTGAVTLALRYGAVIVPMFYHRVRGPYIKATVLPPFPLRATGNADRDVPENVQALTSVFEGFIRKHPGDYLWRYKAWKYSDQRDLLILSDGKTGHLRQSQALARIVRRIWEERGFQVRERTVEVRWRSAWARAFGCFECGVPEATRCELASSAVDAVISCGSALSGINRAIGTSFAARKFVIMRPGWPGMRGFDAVVVPAHDRCRAGKRVLVTAGALNLIDEAALREQADALARAAGITDAASRRYIGVLLGGDTKYFTLSGVEVAGLLQQVREAADKADAGILVTTSRRTSESAVRAVKESCAGLARCALLVVANERNIPGAVEGILGLSAAVVVTPESISMVSEAASSGRPVVVPAYAIDPRHRRFLSGLHSKAHIDWCAPQRVGDELAACLQGRRELTTLNDASQVLSFMQRILDR